MKRFISFIVCVGIIFFQLFSFFSSSLEVKASSSWWNDSWQWRKKIVFNNKDQNENLTNFPVAVKLDSGSFDFEKAQSSGQDIRFIDSDNITTLSYEIEKWDSTNKDAVLWVKIPQIDASTDTDFIYMYYGNPTSSDSQQTTSVWDTNYIGVWHLDESGDGTADEFQDSSSSSNDGQGGGGSGSTLVPTLTSSGRINGAQDFDGGDYVGLGNNYPFERTDSFTLDAWAKADSLGSMAVIAKQLSGAIATGYQFRLDITGKYVFFLNNSVSGGNYIKVTGDTITTTGNFYHIAVTYDGSSSASGIKMYINGVLQNLTVNNDSLSSSILNSSTARIGSADQVGNAFNGVIDEARFSNTIRSTNWIAAEYKNGNDLFNRIQPEEGLSAARVFLDPDLTSAPSGKSRLKGRVESSNTNSLVTNVDCSVNGGSWFGATSLVGGFDSLSEDFVCDFNVSDNSYTGDGYTVKARAKRGSMIVSDDNLVFSAFVINTQNNLKVSPITSLATSSLFPPSISFSINKGRFTDLKSYLSHFRVMVKNINHQESDWTTYIDNIPVDFEKVKLLDENLQRNNYLNRITNGNGVYEDKLIKATYTNDNSTIQVQSKETLSPGTYQYKIISISKSGMSQETNPKTLTILKRQIPRSSQTLGLTTQRTEPTPTPTQTPAPTPIPQPTPTPTPKPKTCFLFWCW